MMLIAYIGAGLACARESGSTGGTKAKPLNVRFPGRRARADLAVLDKLHTIVYGICYGANDRVEGISRQLGPRSMTVERIRGNGQRYDLEPVGVGRQVRA